MNKIFFPALILIVTFSIGLQAQQKSATISFTEEVHNFGMIEEKAGKVTTKFEYTNTGGEPLIISNVKASCGCTTPEWTKEPVPPGGKGYVSATYDPKNRPGIFNKSITVTSNADTPTKVLRIEGEVKPSSYPRNFGDLGLKTDHVGFTKIYNTEIKTEKIEVINNNSEGPLTVKFTNVPDHIKVKITPETLKPGAEGVIEIFYDAKKKNDWGFQIDRLPVELNGDQTNKYQIRVSATIEEDFSKLTPEELANAPKAEFENTVFDFGTIKQGESVSHEFKFKNTGKSDLIIRKTKASCGCTAIAPSDDIIKPGVSSSVKATFNSRGKKGKQNKTITVITNDPHEDGKNATTTLYIRGDVIAE
ncbi:MAG: DUF1573 domain-containing protein [Bacteroidetes bacterium]|nr:DUF1573 domain-containing protein [Bacteroidota bacterium]